MNGAAAIWVFGYGSLIWKQDFPFLESRPASVTGWARRFWQGSHDHRGLPHAPGRVVTLIESPGEVCAGRAFLVRPEVFNHLDHREKNGYERIEIDIEFETDTARGLVYRAAGDNFAFLGPASTAEIAAQIARSAGPSGTNREYVLQLAQALRALGALDSHVFAIEQHLLAMD
ncbi:MAG: gamma-glutamylcyclotransferase [Gammaproteobacteria bacterium]|jgi:cation transport regulator ChaC